MKGFVKLWLTVITFFGLLLFGSQLSLGATPLRESQLIRRVYLDVLGFPPSPKELDWYLTYNSKSYETAVDWVINSHGAYFQNLDPVEMKRYLCSIEYKTTPQIKIIPFQLEMIIKYQCGDLSLSLNDAKIKLTKDAVGFGEGNVLDTIDYIAESLMARVSHAEEATSLLKIYKKYPSEAEGYFNVVSEIMTYKDYLYK